MSKILIVVNTPSRWPLHIPGVEVVAASRYLAEETSRPERTRVFNLCRSYRYQKLGYYVSLLAEARGHMPLPSVSTIQDLKSPSLLRTISGELDELIQKSLAPIQGQEFTLSVYFAKNLAERHARLSRHLFNLFPVPLLRAQFSKVDDQWTLMNVFPISGNQVPENHREFVIQSAREYFQKGVRTARPRRSRYDLAMLVNPAEPTPPSNEKALRLFEKAGNSMGINVERIDRNDYGKVAEYDALFIRETTAVNHHTYRFARRAEANRLVVIDDPRSIVRCTNKVYLAERLQRNQIRAPRTRILHRENIQAVLEEIGTPCVIKQPDSSFSLGVVKAETREEFLQESRRLLEASDLLVVQEFLPTDFDWRVGVLDQEVLFVCKYFMAPNHWQIYNNEAGPSKNDDYCGDTQNLPILETPSRVLDTALKAANLIGNGLYGVDLKESDGKVYVIEVNDNPNVDAGFEDQLAGTRLYEKIMSTFLQRLDRRQSL